MLNADNFAPHMITKMMVPGTLVPWYPGNLVPVSQISVPSTRYQ
jgi:hypothetical protein